MSKEAQSHELTYDLIKRAVHGDQEAIEVYLLHYDAYINSLVAYDEVGPDGRIYRHIDEDMKIEVQMKLVDALQNKWSSPGRALSGNIQCREILETQGFSAFHSPDFTAL